jgi:peptidyl-prolyl cis-trans isomerase A (cyclophilin A)
MEFNVIKCIFHEEGKHLLLLNFKSVAPMQPSMNVLFQRIFFCGIFILLISCNRASNNSDLPVVRLVTTEGDIDIELNVKQAPVTAKHFFEQVKLGKFSNAQFYRVLQSDPGGTYNTGIIQGGVHGTSVEIPSIPHEHTGTTGLTHTDGTVSMARTTPGSATGEFFICVGDQSPLDYGRRGTADSLGMAAFGKVIEGMKTVKKIHNLPARGDRLVKPVQIRKVIVL